VERNPDQVPQPMSLHTVEVEQTDWIKGVAYPANVRYRDIVITGPPCSGKSTLVQKLGGWPEEGYIDLASSHWWYSRVLTFRPREVHFAIPFAGHDESVTVFDQHWLEAPSAIDFGRIQIPPGKAWFLQTDWRKHYLFDFQLPPVEHICAILHRRAQDGSHPRDRIYSDADVARQVRVYEELAGHFTRCGMRVVVRSEFAGMPRRVVDTDLECGRKA